MAIEIAFDKIADVYDAQRGHSPEVAIAIGQAIVSQTGIGAQVLEIGIGSGRIALPTAAAGAQVTGIDLSTAMLATARERAAQAGVPLRLVKADAQTLPFTTATFDAALAVHVLHLLSDWRTALAEMVRVVKPGGVIIQGIDWRDPASCVGLLRGQLRQAVMELLPGARPPGAGAAVTQHLAKLGAPAGEPITAARWERAISPAEVIAGMADRIDAETWALDDEVLQQAIKRVQTWASQRWSDLHEPQLVEHRFLLTVSRTSIATPA
ncbi:class I SAM-dependent methyltransferase [uncultured Chloroflexus sp.]|uniref:class I SAM-dependent methyltransferase n=1 Tax=uncultured Chloroflexus sp. TaxID=214040 RepID=UPI002614C149|nr:class I SAM-dependent methyltransferase [uncultured Chloroflexus sp.]